MIFRMPSSLQNAGLALPFAAALFSSGCATVPYSTATSYAPTDYTKFESRVAKGPEGLSSRGTWIPTFDVWSWGYSFDSRRPNDPYILSCAINIARDSSSCTSFNGEMEIQNPLNQLEKVKIRAAGVENNREILFERFEGWEGPAKGWKVLPNGAAIYGRPVGLSAKECLREGLRQAEAYSRYGTHPPLPARTVGGVRNWCAELRY